MKFLDRKEQVVELQITQYGKNLMSRGTFQPAFYAFFDDDIVYDSKYMSTGGDSSVTAAPLENTVKSSDRIKEALRPEVQYNYVGIESTINQSFYDITTEPSINLLGDPIIQTVAIEKSKGNKLNELSKIPPAVANYYSMGMPMGTSKYSSNKAPAWYLNFHNGEIYAPVTYYTGSSGLVKIPQLEIEAFYMD